MDLQNAGRVLLGVGFGILVLGGLLILASKLPFFNQLGNLPGDIRVEGQGFSCAVPIVTSIVLSLLLTVVLNIVIRLINRP